MGNQCLASRQTLHVAEKELRQAKATFPAETERNKHRITELNVSEHNLDPLKH